MLWEEERKATRNPKKQSFVDLGCGTGLLVHILASEGVSCLHAVCACVRVVWCSGLWSRFSIENIAGLIPAELGRTHHSSPSLSLGGRQQPNVYP